MCLITFAFQSHPDYPLIVAANRDEFFHRPTQSVTFWDEEPNILAGRDLLAGGTWLGINRQGHFSALTNFREGSTDRKFPVSRGELPVMHLRNPEQLEQTIQQLSRRRDEYNGFNLLLGNSNRLSYISNRGDHLQYALQPGVYGLSNASLDTPWPKVVAAKRELSAIVARDWKSLQSRQDDLFKLLADREIAMDDQLPQTGVSLETERMLSSRFICSPDYGTRSSTLLFFHYSGRIHFLEHQYDYGEAATTREYILEV